MAQKFGAGHFAHIKTRPLVGLAVSHIWIRNGGWVPPYQLDVQPTGWTGIGDIVTQGYAGSVPSGNGNQWFDLNPDTSAGTGIHQSIAVTGGTTYDFSFLYNGGGGGTTTQISFAISGLLSGSVSTAALNVYGGSAWQAYSSMFTPTTSGSVTLSFLPNGVLSGGFIDAVDITPVSVAAVPLPAALPLFATGLAGWGLLGWRRKRKAVAE